VTVTTPWDVLSKVSSCLKEIQALLQQIGFGTTRDLEGSKKEGMVLQIDWLFPDADQCDTRPTKN
jgi:hypothetical protein